MLEIDASAEASTERLGERLSAVASGALRSIESDTAAATARLSDLLRRAWIRPWVVGLSLFLGICGGSWATMHWLWRSIELRIEALATLNRQVEEAGWTLDEIEETTWGRDATGNRGGSVRGAAVRHTGESAVDRARSACREAIFASPAPRRSPCSGGFVREPPTYAGPAAKCSSRYRTISIRRWTAVPSPSDNPWFRFGYVM